MLKGWLDGFCAFSLPQYFLDRPLADQHREELRNQRGPVLGREGAGDPVADPEECPSRKWKRHAPLKGSSGLILSYEEART